LVNLFVNSSQLHVFLDLLLCELFHYLPPLFLVGIFIPQNLILYLEQCVVQQQFFKFLQFVMHFGLIYSIIHLPSPTSPSNLRFEHWMLGFTSHTQGR
jgi:hypothetical protein